MRRIVATVALVLGLGACTPAEAIQWWGVLQEHPQGALRFARCVTARPKAWAHPGAARGECRRLGRERQLAWNAAHSGAVAGMQQCGQWADEAWSAGWRSEGYTLGRIMYAESRCYAGAYNPQEHFGGHATGLMQIIDPTWPNAVETCRGGLYDPIVNLRCALYLRTHYGWSQWATY